MAIKDIKDSLKPCDYSNPYATSYVRAPSHLATSFTKDVLEISEDQLKKDALAHLDSAASRIPTGLYVVVARVGKYTFLALFIPPYYLLYIMPKWLITVIAPASFEAISRPIRRLVKMVQRAIKTTVHSIWQPVMHFLKRINAMNQQLYKMIVSINNRIFKAFKKAYDTALIPFQKSFQGINSFLSNLKKFNPFAQVKHFGPLLKKGLIKLLDRRLENLNRLNQKLTNRLKKNVAWFSNKASTILESMQNAFQNSSRLSNRALELIEKMSQIPYDALSKKYNGLKNYISSVMLLFKGVMSDQLKYFNYIQKKIWQAKESCSRFFAPFRRFKDACSQQSRNFFQKRANKANDIIKKLSTRLPQKVQKFFQKNALISMLGRLISFVIRMIKLPFKAFFKIVNALSDATKQLPLIMKKLFTVSALLVLGIYGKIARFVGKIQQASFYVLKMSIYWSLIIVILAGYILLFIGRMFAESSANAASKLKLNNPQV